MCDHVPNVVFSCRPAICKVVFFIFSERAWQMNVIPFQEVVALPCCMGHAMDNRYFTLALLFVVAVYAKLDNR